MTLGKFDVWGFLGGRTHCKTFHANNQLINALKPSMHLTGGDNDIRSRLSRLGGSKKKISALPSAAEIGVHPRKHQRYFALFWRLFTTKVKNQTYLPRYSRIDPSRSRDCRHLGPSISPGLITYQCHCFTTATPIVSSLWTHFLASLHY